MKKILIIIFTLITFNIFAVDKSTTFNIEIFKKAQLEGRTVVINSWNETCTTCKKQIMILDQAENEFKEILFLSFEQTKDKIFFVFSLKISFLSKKIIENLVKKVITPQYIISDQCIIFSLNL